MSKRPTLSLSADQVRADGGALLITMPGDSVDYDDLENAWAGGVRRVDLDHTGPESRRILTVPPSVLVALNQPCPTCDGAGHLGHESWHTWHCPDCENGRLVFDLKTPCDHLVMRQASNSQPICIRCMDDGTVSRRVWLDPEWGIRQIDNGYEARAIIFGGSHE